MTSRRATPSNGTRPMRAASTTIPANTPKAQNCSLRRGHDGEHEEHGRQQLALRGEAVERSLLVHQEVSVCAAHVSSSPGRPPQRERRRRSSHIAPTTTMNVTAMPTRPATTVPTASWSTPFTP